MKYVKMLGLAAVAAMALMAIVGAGSASATVLCKNNTSSPCSEVYGANTVVKAKIKSGTSALLENTSGTIEDTCTESAIQGETANAGSSTTTVESKAIPAANLTWGASCTNTTDTTAGGKLEIHASTGGNGTVTAKEFKVTINLAGVTCTFGAQTGINLGTFTGGTEPTLNINVVVNKVEGSFLCPGDATWKGTYVVTSPTPMFTVTS
ncbi:MAG: hypothetical protein ACTHNP_10480 [Solirubrobacterales bacterium]